MPQDSERPRRVGKYDCYAELARCESLGRDYRVRAIARATSAVLVIAPHGGLIEDGTSELAQAIAGEEHSLFSFEGLKPYGSNRDLHITSHRFDHPECLAMLARSELVLSVHGCRGESRVHLGGRDRPFADRLAQWLTRAGFAVEAGSLRYPGLHPQNICNRGARGAGAQLEFTHDLRTPDMLPHLARAVRAAIDEHRLPAARSAGFG